MKCLRCGLEVEDDIDVCPNCEFSFKEHKTYVKVAIEEDPDLPDEEKVKLIDNPILTLLFGFVSILTGGMFFLLREFVIIFLILAILSFVLTFILSVKPTKVKLKPLREFGMVLGYLGIGLTIMRIVSEIIGLIAG